MSYYHNLGNTNKQLFDAINQSLSGPISTAKSHLPRAILNTISHGLADSNLSEKARH